ncbi:hypothetical protein D3C76_89630 [compost metagenome]
MNNQAQAPVQTAAAQVRPSTLKSASIFVLKCTVAAAIGAGVGMLINKTINR